MGAVLEPNAVKYIVIHCSDSPNLPDDGRLDTAADIHRWHVERGFDGIGYHYVVREDGKFEKGRPDYWRGAHCKGFNHCSIGVCLIGVDEFTPDQLHKCEVIILGLLEKFPDAEVVGHRDLAPGRECPGFDVQYWWSNRFDS